MKCISGKDSILLSPIIHWTSRDVWDFLNGMDIEHCELYDQGRTRIGCILCPMSDYKQHLRDVKDYPYAKEKWVNVIMKIRDMGGGSQGALDKSTTPARRSRIFLFDDNQKWGGDVSEREIAERIFDWWISGKSYSEWYAETFLQQKINFDDDETE